MKRHAFLLVAVASALLVTSCSAQSSASPAPSTGTPVASSASPSATATGTSVPTQASSPSSAPSAPVVAVSGLPIAANATGKPGIATDEQMAVIDKVARAMSNEKYDAAAAAGYYVFDSHGAPVQDTTIMASKREKHADYFDKVKSDYAKGGCQLVPVSINSSGTIYTNMTCNDGSAPDVSVHASFMNGQLDYIDAIYVDK